MSSSVRWGARTLEGSLPSGLLHRVIDTAQFRRKSSHGYADQGFEAETVRIWTDRRSWLDEGLHARAGGMTPIC